MLSEDDRNRLKEAGYNFDILDENGWTNIIFHHYALPEGFTADKVELLVKLPPGFPDQPPDMFWVDPEIRILSTGALPEQAQNREQHVGREWQRFSRHISAGAWRPGVDDLFSWLAAIKQLLKKDVS